MMMFLYFQVRTIVFISRINILKLKKHGTCRLTRVLTMSDMVLFLITVKGCHTFKQTDLAFDFMPQSVRNKLMGLLIPCPNRYGKFKIYMSEFEYWALTIKMSPQSCKEESQYPQPTGLQMTATIMAPPPVAK